MKKLIVFLVISLFVVSFLTQLVDIIKNELSDCPEKSKKILSDKQLYNAMKHQRSWKDAYNTY